jgi:hypothetical protein
MAVHRIAPRLSPRPCLDTRSVLEEWTSNGGQLMSEMWGKVIRVDVNKKDAGLEYAIPDNPFKGQA